MFIRPAILLTCLFAIPWARGADPAPSKDKPDPGVANVLAERRAALAAANNAVNAAMANVAQVRAKHNIADHHPESPGGVAGDKDDPKIAEYLKLKDTYLQAIADSELAGDALRDVLPTEELKIDLERGENFMTRGFAAMAELLQSGEVTDANLEDARSEVIVTGKNKKIAEAYLMHKGLYVTGKSRAAKARAVLEKRKESTEIPSK